MQSRRSRSRPSAAPRPPVDDISTGWAHGCVRTVTGEAWCWGWNLCAQTLGVVGPDTATPTRIDGVAGARDVEAGRTFTCVAHADGTVQCWWVDGGGLCSGPPPIDITDARTLEAGHGIVCATGADDVPRCWGPNMPASTGMPAARLSVGLAHACQVDLDGTVWCWGHNDDLAAGEPRFERGIHPIDLPGPAADVAAGVGHSCAILRDGTVWCWGQNSAGELGAAVGTETGTPARVSGLPEVE